MVNRAPGSRYLALLPGLLLALWLAPSTAAEKFPFDTVLQSADGPLPGCKQPPTLHIAKSPGFLDLGICCNSLRGRALVEGNRIIFSLRGLTAAGCGREAENAEDKFLSEVGDLKEMRWHRDGEFIVVEAKTTLRFRVPKP